MARYFDPTVYKIILVDQRGCGESSQTADISENTTYDLISDFEKIRIKLGRIKLIRLMNFRVLFLVYNEF